MKVHRGLTDLPARRRPSAVTIGNFDGVHLGHRRVIGRVLRHAERQSAEAVCVTFHPHPRKVLGGEAPAALTTFEGKLELLEEAGMARCIVLTFDRELSLVEPEEFAVRIIAGELRARSVVVGSGFRFGHRARGDLDMLRRLGRGVGVDVEGVRLAAVQARPVSSTAIREALAGGDLEWASKALGRNHRVPGTIVRGRGRGAGLGFPTANLEPEEGLCLPHLGVYAGRLVTGRRSMGAAISVGTNPHFGRNPVTVEAFVLDFEGDLYGRKAEVEFERYLRPERRFATTTALARAIEQDVEKARRILR